MYSKHIVPVKTEEKTSFSPSLFYIPTCVPYSNMHGLKEGFEERVKAYKAAAANAATKCSLSEYGLTKEKEAHLRTAR